VSTVQVSTVDGIVLLDKPAGLTSNAALQRVKRCFGARKAGHAGSLDPLASGMLPICLGEATKVAGAMLDARKRYQFTIALGRRTASGDAESPIIEEMPVPELQADDIRSVLAAFTGTRHQTPPMYSALKHQGKPLYRLARRGIEVERAPREIMLEGLTLDRLEAREIDVSATCSKGTYIRSLAEELAAALGTCGYVTHLHRLWSEPFAMQPMHGLETLESAGNEQLAGYLLPPDAALRDLERIELDAGQAKRLSNGQIVDLGNATARGRVRVYDGSGRFLGVATLNESGQLQPERLAARLVTLQPGG
jgi:tRNA pseudouridine55 synthase